MTDLPRGWTLAPLMDIVDLHDSRRVPLNQQERAGRQGPFPYYGANGQVDSIDDYIFEGEYILLAEDGGYFDHPSRGVAYEVSGQFWVNNHAHILVSSFLSPAWPQWDCHKTPAIARSIRGHSDRLRAWASSAIRPEPEQLREP